jgi:hypothetical protein
MLDTLALLYAEHVRLQVLVFTCHFRCILYNDPAASYSTCHETMRLLALLPRYPVLTRAAADVTDPATMVAIASSRYVTASADCTHLHVPCT